VIFSDSISAEYLIINAIESSGRMVMSWKCPSCGRENHDPFNNCECGQSSKGGVLVKEEVKGYEYASEGAEQSVVIPSGCTNDQSRSLQGSSESRDVQLKDNNDAFSYRYDEEVIKEIDSWLFTFSRRDGCISIGTPALQYFRLKISVEDLEDMLEVLYQKTGNEKTIRRLNLSATDIIGVIDKVDRLIDEKKSKVSIKFTSDELQEISDFINVQLKI
jgi:hypothetical protein